MVKIVAYETIYADAFREINEEWINKYFKMEETDRKALYSPEEYILKNGGAILIALENEEPVGVCALMKMEDSKYDFELAKMGVRPDNQGKGIGKRLGKAILDAAKSRGANSICLETNTVLKAAIVLYQKLGFTKVIGNPTPYERCNYQMELHF
ncbi:MAG: GNAT family N-acetyltransferase [Saprospiraceae bacterium]